MSEIFVLAKMQIGATKTPAPRALLIYLAFFLLPFASLPPLFLLHIADNAYSFECNDKVFA